MSHSQDLQARVETYVENPTQANKEAAVIAGVPLVRSLIGKITVPNHPLASHEDIENVGLMGLLQALDQYDPETGTAFASYAYGRIRGAMVDYLRSIDVLPRRKRRRMAEAQTAIEKLRQVLGKEPSDEDVANYLGISLKKYHGLLRQAQRRFSLSIHKQVDEEGNAPVEILPNPNAEAVEERVEHESTIEYMSAMIQQLPERQQTIVGLYYYENLTLREIGTVLDLSEARISQILGKILLTLKSKMHEARSQTS